MGRKVKRGKALVPFSAKFSWFWQKVRPDPVQLCQGWLLALWFLHWYLASNSGFYHLDFIWWACYQWAWSSKTSPQFLGPRVKSWKIYCLLWILLWSYSQSWMKDSKSEYLMSPLIFVKKLLYYSLFLIFIPLNTIAWYIWIVHFHVCCIHIFAM